MAEDKPTQSNHLWSVVKPVFSANANGVAGQTQPKRLWEKIQSLFIRKPDHDPKLVGRIYEMNQNANHLYSELLAVKVDLEKEVEPVLLSLVEAVVDPLIKEARRLKILMEQEKSVSQQVINIKKYSEWIEKAKIWVEICAKRSQKEAIRKAIIDYSIDEFRTVIDRDMQIIQDYLTHFLNELEFLPEEKKELEARLEETLTQHLIGLQKLKAQPDNLSLGMLGSWRVEIDRLREKFFSDSLHTIDTLVQEVAPKLAKEEESEQYLKFVSRCAQLEEKLAVLSRDIERLDLDNIELKKDILARFDTLEDEVHQLNSDLRLDHAHIERLQAVMDQLGNLRQTYL